MNKRAVGFLSLLTVVGASIVFGMLLGGKLNAPRVVYAAPPTHVVRLAPATTTSVGTATGFADIVEAAMPAVVSVTSAQLPDREDGDEGEGDPNFEEQMWRWFFGPDRQMPEEHPRFREQNPRPRVGEGSGFIISKDGFILTNHHVIDGADSVRVGLNDGKEFDAVVVGKDPSIDLALLKIDPGSDDLPVLPLGDSDALRVGEWVIAIGNPLAYEHTVTVGVVSAKTRQVPLPGTDAGVARFIQTDAAINFGNSGGPLIDASGNVIGINTAIQRAMGAEGIGFALPVNHARGVIEQLRETGEVRRGYIGITMNPNPIDEAARDWYGLPDTKGVIVAEVTLSGPADKAGIRKDDVIRGIDGQPIGDNLGLISTIASHAPGDRVSVEVFRDGRTRTVEAVLGDRVEGLQAQVGGPAQVEPQPKRIQRESKALGFTVESLTDEWRRRLELSEDQAGILITDVEYGTEAQRKGLAPNMVVTSINNVPVGSVEEWVGQVDDLRSGAPVKLDVVAGPRAFSAYLRVPPRDGE